MLGSGLSNVLFALENPGCIQVKYSYYKLAHVMDLFEQKWCIAKYFVPSEGLLLLFLK